MTISATGRGLDQFRGDIPIYTLTFAKSLSPTELLTRMGVDPDTLALRDPMDLHDDFDDTLYDEDEPVVTTGTDGAWTWAWEQGGSHGLDARILSEVSRGPRPLLCTTTKSRCTGSSTRSTATSSSTSTRSSRSNRPAWTRSGSTRSLRPLGLIPGRSDPLHSVLALAENAFGLRVTTAGDDDERWSGSLLPLPE